MNRLFRRRIFVMIIILIVFVLFISLILILIKIVPVSIWKQIFEFIIKENLVIQAIAAIMTVIYFIITSIYKLIYTFINIRKSKTSEIKLTKTKIRAIFPVQEIMQLKELSNPYMEDVIEGKTFEEIKAQIDFSKLKPIDLSTKHRIYFIKGKPGAGKSTYILWSLYESLRNESWEFDKIVFLHPDAYEQWAEELYEYNPKHTLLIIDALRRGGDTDEVFKRRFFQLLELTRGELSLDERTIGPFKALVTLRDDEYDFLVKQREFQGIKDSSFLIYEYPITPDKLDFEKILKKYLKSYNVQYDIQPEKEYIVISKLITQSEGLPYYIRHLVANLSITNRRFSEKILDDYPKGMNTLIWQTIKRGYYIEDDLIIPFLLLLLLDTEKGFSNHYFSFVTEKLAEKSQKKNIMQRVENLMKVYFQSSLGVTNFKDAETFSLDSHWRISLRTGLEQTEDIRDEYRDVVNFYKRVKDEQFQRLKNKIAMDLKTHLQEGFKDKADIFLCLDLAKMGEEHLETATIIFTDFSSTSRLKQDYIRYMQEELYELWISYAWKYRAVYDDDKVIRCYKNAFDKLGVRTHRKQLHAYAYYLQTRVLPRYKYGTSKFQEYTKEIESLYNEVINLQPNDPINYQTLALFYKNLGEYQKAEENFKKALQINPSHIPTFKAYAIFLKDMGNVEWGRNRIKALECYNEAQEKFKTAINLLKTKAEKEELTEREKQWEKEVINAYAVFLIDQAGWQATRDEKRKYDEVADAVFEEILKKYPDHNESINKYADFLMKYGRILPKYKDGKNLEKAEKLLSASIAESENRNEAPDPITLHTLAILLYKFKKPPDFERASKLLKESAGSPNPKHNSIAYHELGRLYMRWAKQFLRNNQFEYNTKMDLAEKAILKALELPENPMNFMHLSRVYLTYAFYSTYKRQIEQARVYRNKAFELVKQTQLIPIFYYLLLNSMGDEVIENEPEEAIDFYTKAKEVGEELKLNTSYPYFKIGECYKKIGKIEDALNAYLQSAKIEKTSEGYGTRRDSIKQLMKDKDISKRTQPVLYAKCIEARRECSEKACQLDPNSWKNYGDYGEDLLELGEYTLARNVLEKGVSLISQSEELNEIDKRKKLSWFYEKIGFCYLDQGTFAEAEKYFLESAKMEDSALSYFRLTSWMYELKKYAETITAFQTFIEKFPSCGVKEKEIIFHGINKVLKILAVSYEKLNQKDSSAAYWKNYADISYYLRDAKACGIAGNKLMREHIRRFEARECFIKSIRLNTLPAIFAKNLSQLGYINKILGRWEECMICFKQAYELRHDERDRRQCEFCQQQLENNPKRYDTNKIGDLIDIAIISELKGENKDALNYYLDALKKLNEYGRIEQENISQYMFIADAIWALGKPNDTLKIYEDIKKYISGFQEIIVEAIIWFILKEIK